MNAILHALNIGTMAVWLSVGAFGVVGIVVPTAVELVIQAEEEVPYADLEVSEWSEDIAANELPASQATGTGTSGEADEQDVPFDEIETLPGPPELPEMAEATPLPEIPDLPPPAPKQAGPRETSASPRAARSHRGSTSGSGGSRGSAGRGGGSGMSDAKRLAGGRMPPPSYPGEARRKGQTGTVLVEFVVGADGRVVSAHAKRPSPWPLLNNAAVRAVRRWRFPAAGKTTKYIRPIVFQLR